MRTAPQLALSEPDLEQLRGWSQGRKTEVRVMERAKIILLAHRGMQNKEIALELGVTRRTVGRWRRRAAAQGVESILRDAPRSGRIRRISQEKVQEVVRLTTQERPRAATHWSTRTMAEQAGVSAATVRRVWHQFGLKPHLVRTFKISNDPRFAEKLEDVVGLYIAPPEHAIVLCVDEKSQVQALDRSQPSLPMKKGRGETMTHDYKRNGTTTLFAAMDTLNGQLITACMPRHRHQEWLTFLKLLDQKTDQDKELHLIADNYATHKHPVVQRWLAKHPRIHMHFTPTSSSWLNMVERFFRDLTGKQLKRGVFRNVAELITAIDAYIAKHNENPKPFIWTAKAADILEKVKRARAVLHKFPSV